MFSGDQMSHWRHNGDLQSSRSNTILFSVRSFHSYSLCTHPHLPPPPRQHKKVLFGEKRGIRHKVSQKYFMSLLNFFLKNNCFFSVFPSSASFFAHSIQCYAKPLSRICKIFHKNKKKGKFLHLFL